MRSKTSWSLAAVFLIVLAVAVGRWLLWYAPPLRPSSDYTVTYSVDNQSHSDAQLFRPVGISSRYYILVPSSSRPEYRWFVVDFANGLAALPLFGVTCPCGSPCVHRDQALGVQLTGSKVGDHWQVSVTPDAASFSNRTMSVSLTRSH
jgi:hypothetical protein